MGKSKKSQLSPIFKKRLNFFQKLGKLSEKRQKAVLTEAPKKVTQNLVKLVKLVKKEKLPPKHYKRLKPFKTCINCIIKKSKNGSKGVIKVLKGGLIGSLLPLLISVARPAISALTQALS